MITVIMCSALRYLKIADLIPHVNIVVHVNMLVPSIDQMRIIVEEEQLCDTIVTFGCDRCRIFELHHSSIVGCLY